MYCFKLKPMIPALILIVLFFTQAQGQAYEYINISNPLFK